MIGSLMKLLASGVPQGPTDNRGGPVMGGPMQPVTSAGGGGVMSGTGSPVMSRFGQQPAAPFSMPPASGDDDSEQFEVEEPEAQAANPVSSAVVGMLRQKMMESSGLGMPPQTGMGRVSVPTPMTVQAQEETPLEPGFEPDWEAGQGWSDEPNLRAPEVIVPVKRDGARDWQTGEENLRGSLRSAYGKVGRTKPAPFGRQ